MIRAANDIDLTAGELEEADKIVIDVETVAIDGEYILTRSDIKRRSTSSDVERFCQLMDVESNVKLSDGEGIICKSGTIAQAHTNVVNASLLSLNSP